MAPRNRVVSSLNPPRFGRRLRRAVIVLRSFDLGGAERQASLLANGLLRTGRFSVSVVAFEPGTRVPALLDPLIPAAVLHPGSGRNPRRIVSTVRFIGGLKGLQPDILIPFTDWPNKVVGAVWEWTGAKACIWNQRDEGREITGSFLERRALRRVSAFVANSRSGADFLIGTFGIDPNRITLIPNVVVPLKARRSREQWCADLSIDRDSFVVTMVASLSRFKDHETLLDAWPGIRRSVPGAVLLLAGREGDRAASIRKKVAGLKGVQLLGEVDDVGGLLDASDLLVHCSYLEGMPNAVLEGMAAGLPVIATNCPGTREALGSDNRWLVPIRDASALATATMTLAQNPGLRVRVGKKNKERTLLTFSSEKILNKWLRIL